MRKGTRSHAKRIEHNALANGMCGSTRRPFPDSSLALAARDTQPLCPMKNEVVAVTVRGVMPTANGCAIFLGTDEKTFVIHVDSFVGQAIEMTIKGVKRERPLTHDLIGSIFLGLGVRLDHIVINHVESGTFFARIFLRMENELGKKIIELDARPSDSTVLALQHQRPIFVARSVLDTVEDMSEVLERVQQQQAENPTAAPEVLEGDDAEEEDDDDTPEFDLGDDPDGPDEDDSDDKKKKRKK